MQNRSSAAASARPRPSGRARRPGSLARYQPRYEPHHLPAAFPFRAIAWLHPDRPVAYLHRHDVLEIGYCHEGSGTYLVEDKVLPFTAGCVTVISERELHFAQNTPGTTSRWTYLFLDPLRLAGALGDERDVLATGRLCGSGFTNVIAPDAHPALCRLVAELAAEGLAGHPGRRAAIRGLVAAVMAHLHRLPRGRGGANAPRPPAQIARVAPALACIGEHHRARLTIPALARACGLPASTFRRAFVQAFDQSPKQYLTNFRVRQAASLLRSGQGSVLDAALASGFASLSGFNRHFRAVLGCSPREWRRG